MTNFSKTRPVKTGGAHTGTKKSYCVVLDENVLADLKQMHGSFNLSATLRNLLAAMAYGDDDSRE